MSTMIPLSLYIMNDWVTKDYKWWKEKWSYVRQSNLVLQNRTWQVEKNMGN